MRDDLRSGGGQFKIGREPTTRDVIALLGGLGNQLFQVAFARWLRHRTGRETWYDVSFHRDLALDVFDVPGIGEHVRERMLTETRRWPTPDGRVSLIGRILRRARGPRRIVRDYSSPGQRIPERPEAAWWFGYWQRADFAEALLPELVATQMNGSALEPRPVIGVHVRRGDMLRTQSAVPAAWFPRAIERLQAELGTKGPALPVRVWSDDLEWCRSELDLGLPFEVALDGSATEHLVALSRCKGLVLSRSTFSWWTAAIASQRGARVAFPTPWWIDAPGLEDAIVPPQWLPVDCHPTTGAEKN